MPLENGTKRTTNLGHGVVYFESVGDILANGFMSPRHAMAEAAALADELWREFELHHVSAPIIKYFQEHDLENGEGDWWAGLDFTFAKGAIEQRQRINHIFRCYGIIDAWTEQRGSDVFYRVRITCWAVWIDNDPCCHLTTHPGEMLSLPTSP